VLKVSFDTSSQSGSLPKIKSSKFMLHPLYLKLLTKQIIQVTEMTAKCLNANPCKEIEIAKRLTGQKESGLFIKIPNTIKLQNIEVIRTWKA